MEFFKNVKWWPSGGGGNTCHFIPLFSCHPEKVEKVVREKVESIPLTPLSGAQKVEYGGIDTTFLPFHSTFLARFQKWSYVV